MSEDAPSSAIRLPSGVKIGAGRETSQTNDAGQVIQGMAFPLTTAAGSTSTVFIPYTEIHNPSRVQQIIDQRVAAITAISG